VKTTKKSICKNGYVMRMLITKSHLKVKPARLNKCIMLTLTLLKLWYAGKKTRSCLFEWMSMEERLQSAE